MNSDSIDKVGLVGVVVWWFVVLCVSTKVEWSVKEVFLNIPGRGTCAFLLLYWSSA